MGTPSKSTFWLCMLVLKLFGAVVSASAIYVGILLFRTLQPFIASPPDGEALIVNVLYYTGIGIGLYRRASLDASCAAAIQTTYGRRTHPQPVKVVFFAMQRS